MVKYEEIVKVRPTFKKQFLPNREPLQYMKKPERKNILQPIEHTRNSSRSRKDSRTTVDTIETPTIDLSTALKIEVGGYPFDKRGQVKQCAEVLEQILKAVSDGRSSLESAKRSRPSVRINKVEKQKMDQQNKDRVMSKKKEVQRKKREIEVKQKVEVMKLQKEKEADERLKLFEGAEKGELFK
jgi:hypothetical protein